MRMSIIQQQQDLPPSFFCPVLQVSKPVLKEKTSHPGLLVAAIIISKLPTSLLAKTSGLVGMADEKKRQLVTSISVAGQRNSDARFVFLKAYHLSSRNSLIGCHCVEQASLIHVVNITKNKLVRDSSQLGQGFLNSGNICGPTFSMRAEAAEAMPFLAFFQPTIREFRLLKIWNMLQFTKLQRFISYQKAGQRDASCLAL